MACGETGISRGTTGAGAITGCACATSTGEDTTGLGSAVISAGVRDPVPRSASSSSKSNTIGALGEFGIASDFSSPRRRRRPPRRPRRRELFASPSVSVARAGDGATPMFSATAGFGATGGAANGAGTSRFGRSGSGCCCGLRCCCCVGCSPLSCRGRCSRRCCCFPSPRERSRSRCPPRESPRLASRDSSRRRGSAAGFAARTGAAVSSASVFSGTAGLPVNSAFMRAKKPGAGVAAITGGATATMTSGSALIGAGLAGTTPLTAGFSGSAPGLATCGGGADTTGVSRS